MRLNPANGVMESHSIPDLVLIALAPLVTALEELAGRIKRLEVEIARWHLADETSRRLGDHPRLRRHDRIGHVGEHCRSSMLASGREFAAWLGLTPRQNSSGGKERLGGITKMGDRYLRTLLVH